LITEIAQPRDPARRSQRGFSLTEMLVVIAALAILVTMGIISMQGVDRYAAQSVAQRNLDLLNGAVNAFNNANWKLPVDVSGGSEDEQTVFYSLQYRDAQNPAPGSPYLETYLAFVPTSSQERYRAVWNGTYFQMSEPGVDGSGIDLEAMVSGGSGPPGTFRPPVPSAD
jgi:prepilin-type N-terminal cleavage/methylation domain-containing protein